jgi:hypothetical protein
MNMPASVAAQSKARMVLDRSEIGMGGSNPVRYIDVCMRFSVLCCPV